MNGGVRLEPHRHPRDAGFLVLALHQVLLHRVDRVRLDAFRPERLDETAQLVAREREPGHQRRIHQGHVDCYRKTFEQVVDRGRLADAARGRRLDVEKEMPADEPLGAGDVLNRVDDFDAHVRLRAAACRPSGKSAQGYSTIALRGIDRPGPRPVQWGVCYRGVRQVRVRTQCAARGLGGRDGLLARGP